MPDTKKCRYDKQYGDIICKDGELWALTYSEMGPPDSRQHHGPCPYCKKSEWKDPPNYDPQYDTPRVCDACRYGEHWNCGMQSWCECECGGPNEVDHARHEGNGTLA